MENNELKSFSPSDLSNLLHGGANIPQVFSREIFLIRTRVAGCQYQENMRERIEQVEEGEILTFYREPENPYDELAILVLNDEGNKIGYVPRKDNTVIANLMDAGKRIYAKASAVSHDWDRPWKCVIMDVYMED